MQTYFLASSVPATKLSKNVKQISFTATARNLDHHRLQQGLGGARRPGLGKNRQFEGFDKVLVRRKGGEHAGPTAPLNNRFKLGGP